MRTVRLPLAAALATAFAVPAQAEVPIDVIGNTEISFEGLLQFDLYQYSQDIGRADGLALTPAQITANTLSNHGQMRRGEMVFKGKTPTAEWTIGYDTVGSRGSGRNGRWLDVSWKSRINADWSYRVGQFKQPNSLEELTSSKNNDFISKATVTNVYGMSRRVGAELQYATPSMTATGTWFTREINANQRVGDGFGARLTWAPLLDASAGQALHFGVSAVQLDAENNRYSIGSRPQADITTVNTISATLTDADKTRILGAEAMYYAGPVKVMGEYFRATTDRLGVAPDYGTDGWYVSGLYTLGGEKFSYRDGLYRTPSASDPVAGMWQLGARYDRLDANDGAIYGGTQKAFTVGASWYLRSNFRMTLNYVKVDSERLQSGVLIENNPDIIEFRGQIML